MIQDEFNNINVTNDQQLSDIEFGKIQNTEYSDNGDTSLRSRKLSSNLKETTKQVETVSESATTSEVVTTVSGSVTASSIASTTTSVLVVASTVAVGTISVATGISLALYGYEAKFNSLIVSANQLNYSLIIDDPKRDSSKEEYDYNDDLHFEDEISKNTFNLRVFNSSYDRTEIVYPYYENSGVFDGLTLGQTYTITITENKEKGGTIYEDTFTTSLNSAVLDFYLSTSFSSYYNELSYEISYIDDLNALKDFNLSLLRIDHDPINISLPKEQGWQTISLMDLDIEPIEADVLYKYELSYFKNDKKEVFNSGKITFYDYYQPVSEFYSFIFDKTADFATGEFTVTLDYKDDLDIYSDFNLLLTPNNVATSAPETLVIPLKDVSEPQTINGFEYGLVYEGVSYDYELKCIKESEIVTLEAGKVTFTDIYNRESIFYELIFDGSANYKDNTFTLTLNYEDPFNYYDEFVLKIFRGPDDVDGTAIPLEKTTEVQTISAETYDMSFKFAPYTYSLSCMYRGEETFLTSGDVTFYDTSGAIVEFNGLIFDKKANFDTREFSLQLDYVDDLYSLYSFTFTLTDLTTSETKEFILDKTTDVQTFVVDEQTTDAYSGEPVYLIDIAEHKMSYHFEYYNDGELVVPVEGEEFYFENSLVSTFNDVESPFDFIEESSGSMYYLPIKFDYDDAAHVYSYFDVSIRTGGEVDSDIAATFAFEGDNVNKNWQYASLRLEDGYEDVSSLLAVDDLYLVITYTTRETETHPLVEEIVLYSEQIDFTMNQTSKTIFGAFVRNEEMYAGDYGIDISPVFVGSSDEFECEVIVETSTGKTYTMTYSMPSMGNYSSVYISNCVEDYFDVNTIDSELEAGVTVYLRYCTLSTDPTAPGEVIRSEYITLTLVTNYVFVVQH